MNKISVLEQKRDYVVLRVPRGFIDRPEVKKRIFNKDDALKILKAGVREYKNKKTKKLTSLAELRK